MRKLLRTRKKQKRRSRRSLKQVAYKMNIFPFYALLTGKYRRSSSSTSLGLKAIFLAEIVVLPTQVDLTINIFNILAGLQTL